MVNLSGLSKPVLPSSTDGKVPSVESKGKKSAFSDIFSNQLRDSRLSDKQIGADFKKLSPDRKDLPKQSKQEPVAANERPKALDQRNDRTEANPVERNFKSNAAEKRDIVSKPDQRSEIGPDEDVQDQGEALNDYDVVAERKVSREVPEATSESVKGSSEEKIMKKFLKKIEAELGISPEQFVNAITSVKPELMQLPPEVTASEVVNQFQLTPVQKQRAEQLYLNMLSETASAQMADQLSDANVSLDVATASDVRLKKTIDGIDRLNREFFGTGKPVNVDATPKVTDKVITSDANESDSTEDIKSFFPPKVFSPVRAENIGKGAGLKAPVSETPSAPTASATSKNTQAMASQLGQTTHVTNSKSGSNEDATNLLSDNSQNSQVIPTNVTPTKDSEFASAMGTTKTNGELNTQEAQNVRNVIEKANVLVKQGGGEMSVQLQPEGMGKVHIKVSVENGHVGIQMLTDNKEAHSLLENGLKDLKTSLAYHNLSMDTVKVDTNSQLGDMLKHQADLAQQNQRESAREFLGQFRQENAANRQDVFDPSQLPKDRSRPAYRPNVQSQRAQSSRRLDLVA